MMHMVRLLTVANFRSTNCTKLCCMGVQVRPFEIGNFKIYIRICFPVEISIDSIILRLLVNFTNLTFQFILFILRNLINFILIYNSKIFIVESVFT